MDKLQKFANIIDLEKDEFIFATRDNSDHFFFIIDGEVSIQLFSYERGSILLEVVKNGYLLGWSWLNPPYKWKFDALTDKKTKLIAFKAEDIRNEMENDNGFGYRIQKIFMKIIIDRLQSTRTRLLKEFGDNIYIPE